MIDHRLERLTHSLERVRESHRVSHWNVDDGRRRPIPDALHDHEILTGRNLRDAEPSVRPGADADVDVPRIEMNAPCIGTRPVSLTTPSIVPNALGPRRSGPRFEPRPEPAPRPASQRSDASETSELAKAIHGTVQQSSTKTSESIEAGDRIIPRPPASVYNMTSTSVAS